MKGNGKIIDEGLAALKLAFTDAQFLSAEAKEVSERIQLGEHRHLGIPDGMIMHVYGIITEGDNIELSFTSDSGNGYIANIESYDDMIALMQGKLNVIPVEQEGLA